MNMIEPRLDLYFLEDDAEHGKEQSIGKAGIVRNSISISYQLLNGLKPSSNRAFLTVLADSTAVEDMIRAEGNIGAVLSDGNDIWFTGYLSTDWNWTVTDRGVSALSITIEDVGTRLLKKRVPGVGAIGSGAGFSECRKYLKSIKLNMDAVHDDYEPDTSISLFGRKFDYPFFVAPIGGMPFNYTGYLTEEEYSEITVQGALESGIFAFTGDGPLDDYFPSTLPVIKKAGGIAVSTVKPWAREKVFSRIKDLEEVGCMAYAMDLDSAALVNLKLKGKPAYTKSADELKEFADATTMPFLVKGIMTPKSALKCVQAGAYGIVVSNHGGRIMEDFPAPCSVLKEIREAVGDSLKIFVDGGIRSGADVFKCLALGADAVLIGRPYAVVAHGGREEGVKLYTQKIGIELKEVMRMTGCRSLRHITEECIRCN